MREDEGNIILELYRTPLEALGDRLSELITALSLHRSAILTSRTELALGADEGRDDLSRIEAHLSDIGEAIRKDRYIAESVNDLRETIRLELGSELEEIRVRVGGIADGTSRLVLPAYIAAASLAFIAFRLVTG